MNHQLLSGFFLEDKKEQLITILKKQYCDILFMIIYLSEEEMRQINRFSLELTGDGDAFHVVQPDDIRFTMRFIGKRFGENLYRKALGYCVSLIVLPNEQ